MFRIPPRSKNFLRTSARLFNISRRFLQGEGHCRQPSIRIVFGDRFGKALTEPRSPITQDFRLLALQGMVSRNRLARPAQAPNIGNYLRDCLVVFRRDFGIEIEPIERPRERRVGNHRHAVSGRHVPYPRGQRI